MPIKNFVSLSRINYTDCIACISKSKYNLPILCNTTPQYISALNRSKLFFLKDSSNTLSNPNIFDSNFTYA